MENLRVGDIVKINKNYGNTIKEGDIGVLLRIVNCDDCDEVLVNLDTTRTIYIKDITLIKSKKDADKEIKEFKNKALSSIKDDNKLKELTLNKIEIRDIRDELNYELRNKNSYLERLNDTNLRIRKLQNQIEGLKLGDSGEKEKLSNELSLILNHPTVMDVRIESGRISVYTDYIDMYDEEGFRFKGNAYRIVFDLEYNAPNIFGLDPKYCRESCWSHRDPHPHINGRSGEPCYGNSGSMIASAMSDTELYVAYTIVLNFLQQVNTSDSAGAKVRNWDCVDEDGDIIDNPHEKETYTCGICNWETDNDDDMYVCEDCEISVCYECSEYDEEYGRICERCISENYTRCPECNGLIRDDEGYEGEKSGIFCCQDCYDNCYPNEEEEEEGAF